MRYANVNGVKSEAQPKMRGYAAPAMGRLLPNVESMSFGTGLICP